MMVFAVIGAQALYLLFVWLLSAAIGSWISDRRGYGEKVGLAFGLILVGDRSADRARAAGAPWLEVEDRGVGAASAQRWRVALMR